MEQHSESVGNDKITGNVDGAKNTIVGNHNRQSIREDASDRRQFNEITNRFDAPDASRIASLEQRVSTLESMLTTRFLIADGQRENLKDEIDEIRSELRGKPSTVAPPVTWHFWLSIILAAVVAVTMWIFIMRLDTVIDRLPKAPQEQRQP